jgi:hydrogenase maturation protein HypF
VDLERRAIRVQGVVQGVGFRPAVYRLASNLGLSGFVLNDRDGVWIEIEGERTTLDHFTTSLLAAPPLGSRIDRLESNAIAARADGAFRIAASPVAVGGHAHAAIPADAAPCDDCQRELFDSRDRRFRYPFINCTACGPRFTIVREVPYDRSSTTMAVFAMCEECHREYEDPADRRFHAVPNACPACGPRAQLLDRDGRALHDGDDAVRAAASAIFDGAIVAIKGVGGFVLAADACDERAIAKLRTRKRRPHRPFAVMGRSLDALRGIAVLDENAIALVTSRMRPIAVVPARAERLAPNIAPHLSELGVYLPPTPLQMLIATDGPPLQVMTSGNVAEEPIARTDAEARARLAGVADLLLVHDREVHSRADDSVVRNTRRGAIPIRRARGYVPDAIDLPTPGPPVLAVGGHGRNTICFAHHGRAVLSQHVGDLDHPDAEAFFREAIGHLQQLLGATPVAVAHDLHPDYRSTRWARACGLPAIGVQHHHAHVASCLAEHGRTTRVTGIAFDGTGLGDGELWGGEILDADLGVSVRRGHLRAIALVGGEAAIHAPWRLAAAALIDAGEPLDLVPRVAARARDHVRALLATDLPARSTGAGRWFDAVASLLGVAHEVSYDGQAAAQLEALAGAEIGAPFEIAIAEGAPFEIDLRPAIRELACELRRGASRARLAARFHATLAAAIQVACRRADRGAIVLTGGCFQNRRLLDETSARLEADGFEVLVHRRVPPNDGGLALGQAAVASCRLAEREAACA